MIFVLHVLHGLLGSVRPLKTIQTTRTSDALAAGTLGNRYGTERNHQGVGKCREQARMQDTVRACRTSPKMSCMPKGALRILLHSEKSAHKTCTFRIENPETIPIPRRRKKPYGLRKSQRRNIPDAGHQVHAGHSQFWTYFP